MELNVKRSFNVSTFTKWEWPLSNGRVTAENQLFSICVIFRKKAHGLWVFDYNQLGESPLKPIAEPLPTVALNFDYENVEEEVGRYSNPETYCLNVTPMQVPQLALDSSVTLTGGVYVSPKNGLFPAAWPADQLPPGCEERFRILGISVAKCLQVKKSIRCIWRSRLKTTSLR